MTNCTEPNRAACPRLCSDFCNAKEESNRPMDTADYSASDVPETDAWIETQPLTTPKQ